MITKEIKGHLYRYEETWDPKTKKPAWKYLGPVDPVRGKGKAKADRRPMVTGKKGKAPMVTETKEARLKRLARDREIRKCGGKPREIERLLAEAAKPPDWCPDCEQTVDEPEPAYECGDCGLTSPYGTESNQCDCGKFAAKVTDQACPDCGTELVEKEPMVTGKGLAAMVADYESWSEKKKDAFNARVMAKSRGEPLDDLPFPEDVED